MRWHGSRRKSRLWVWLESCDKMFTFIIYSRRVDFSLSHWVQKWNSVHSHRVPRTWIIFSLGALEPDLLNFWRATQTNRKSKVWFGSNISTTSNFVFHLNLKAYDRVRKKNRSSEKVQIVFYVWKWPKKSGLINSSWSYKHCQSINTLVVISFFVFTVRYVLCKLNYFHDYKHFFSNFPNLILLQRYHFMEKSRSCSLILFLVK